MRYPTIPVRRVKIRSVDSFGGLNREPRPGAGEFTFMENLTSQAYPLLTPRSKRGVYAKPASPQGLIAMDRLCYVDGADFVMGQERISMDLSVQPEDCPKTLQAMGAYVIILPDGKYINTLNPEDKGDIEAVFSAESITAALCREDGETLENVTVGDAAPEEGLWLDTSESLPVLREYSQSQGQWGEITAFTSLSAPGVGAGFFPGDTVRIFGALWQVAAAEENKLVLQGAMKPGPLENPEIARRMPRMDFITESGNRLWGCRYGPDRKGNFVNEVYASKLGDFRNWETFQGLSTDSYAVSFGDAGPFTGAATFLGSPLFFREECIHKVYGTEPASYRVQTTHCQGVQEGSDKSIARVGNCLIYKGRDGVYSYDGAFPSDISRELGREKRHSAAAGVLGNRYYISMAEEEGHSLYVWDASLRLWHREDSLSCSHLVGFGGEIYAVDRSSQNILGLLGTGEQEQEVKWEAEFAPFGLEDVQHKHISRLVLRLSMEKGSRMECLARYDDEDTWHSLCMIFGTDLRSLRLPLRPRRCDHMVLKLRGAGNVKLYSVARIYEKGSD